MNHATNVRMQRNGILIGRKFREFFLPSVLMAASASLSLIIDSIIVGNMLGEDALAAMNLIMPLSLCFTAISAMLGIGSATYIAALKGRMEHESADKCLTLSGAAWIALSMIGVCLGLFVNDSIAAFLSGASGLGALVQEYLKVYLIGSPFTFVTLIFPYIIKADGKPKLSSNVLIVANLTNLCLDVVFMGPFQMGLAGGALATVTGNAVGTALYLIYVFSRGRTLHLTKVIAADFRLYADMFKMSISSIFGQALMFAKIWIFNMVISATAGQAGLTAFSICTSCLSFVSMFISGGAQTMIPMVSAFNGAKDGSAIGITVKKSIQIILTCCVGATVLFQIFPQMVMALYGVTGGDALEIGIVAVRVFSLAFIGIGFSFMFMYYVQARKMPAFSMQICALEGFVIIVPMCLLLAYMLGNVGIWLSYIVNEILVAVFIVLKANYTVKKSEGRLYSLFMLEKAEGEKLELSVDVSDAAEIAAALEMLSVYVKEKYPQAVEIRPVLEDIIRLAQYAYGEGSGLKKGASVDIIAADGSISFKDMAKDYRMLAKQEYQNNVRKHNRNYNSTLMIGMNYSSIVI